MTPHEYPVVIGRDDALPLVPGTPDRQHHPVQPRRGHVTVTTGTTAAQAFLRIANTGPPIVPGEADRLLEPFVRGEGTRTDDGAGLGLSIVRAIVLAHHGESPPPPARPAGWTSLSTSPARTDPEPRKPRRLVRTRNRQALRSSQCDRLCHSDPPVGKPGSRTATF
ncbi:ATP-binding protein [Amycolatopsis sp.]|jgi:hypothetical protein|uniref:ATP-binding protein n=1 Tax=Amycolatopsis sp. TaxID=37632 RepID=UPI002DFF8509|nr:ATP-binding protein [Amycolatopsis sp.]